MPQLADRDFADANALAPLLAAKLCMLASLNSPNILKQRLFGHRSDFTPAQNALPTSPRNGRYDWTTKIIPTYVTPSPIQAMIRTWNAALGKPRYRWSRDHVLPNELSAARDPAPPRAIVFEV
jgi:hypothetical protein